MSRLQQYAAGYPLGAKPSERLPPASQNYWFQSDFTLDASGVQRFSLSWSHDVFLIAIKNDAERQFYELEATQQQWSLRERKRQFNASLYKRLALIRDKDEVRRLALEGRQIAQPRDLLRDPYVLEFLALEERAKYSESDLETAIIDKLEHFLLELGKGFSLRLAKNVLPMPKNTSLLTLFSTSACSAATFC